MKTLIIKLGHSETLDPEISGVTSLGDILRTTVILHPFKNHSVSWLVDKKGYPLLKDNPFIDRILSYDLDAVLQLQSERFDIVINLEKVPGICALADSINAWRRYGFGFNEKDGTIKTYSGSQAPVDSVTTIDQKRSNSKSWQEKLFEIIEQKWNGEEYVLGYVPASSEEHDIGFNHQVGVKWGNKAWPLENWKELDRLLNTSFSISWQRGLSNLYEYIDWINSCRLLVTNDSLGVHIAVALKKNVLCLYGPTSPSEMYDYGRLIRILPDVEYDCIPCFEKQCNKSRPCMALISPERVADEVDKFFDRQREKVTAAAPIHSVK